MLKNLLNRRPSKVLKPFDVSSSFNQLRITFCDKNEVAASALANQFRLVKEVRVMVDNALTVKADAIVSPANSFGDMGGGIDKAIDDFYQGVAQKQIRHSIRYDYFGELPVGVAIILPMNRKRLPFLIAAPTMRIPGSVKGTLNAYLAMRAVLVTVLKYNQMTQNRIRHILVPSLCTGVGRMPPEESAEQMYSAHQNIISGNWQEIIHPSMAPYVLHKQNRE